MKTAATLAAVACVLVILALVSGGPEKLGSIPAELLGVWQADDADYADRYLELRAKSVVFGTGQGAAQTYAVHDVRRSEEPGRVLYTVSYSGEDSARQTLSLSYDPGQGSIRLQNQRKRTWWRIKVGP